MKFSFLEIFIYFKSTFFQHIIFLSQKHTHKRKIIPYHPFPHSYSLHHGNQAAPIRTWTRRPGGPRRLQPMGLTPAQLSSAEHCYISFIFCTKISKCWKAEDFGWSSITCFFFLSAEVYITDVGANPSCRRMNIYLSAEQNHCWF